MKRAWKTTEIEYLRQHYAADGAAEVAKALGRSVNSVVHAASTYGASRPKRPPTLEGIKARCIEEGDCWLWQGATDGHGRANMRYEGRSQPVRRVVRGLVDGKPVSAKKRVPAVCGNPSCVSPACSMVTTQQAATRMAAQRGAYGTPDRVAKGVLTVRAKSPFSEDVIRLVREHTGPARLAAAEAGMSLSHAKAIRRGTARRDMSNPFSRMGA